MFLYDLSLLWSASALSEERNGSKHEEPITMGKESKVGHLCFDGRPFSLFMLGGGFLQSTIINIFENGGAGRGARDTLTYNYFSMIKITDFKTTFHNFCVTNPYTSAR